MIHTGSSSVKKHRFFTMSASVHLTHAGHYTFVLMLAQQPPQSLSHQTTSMSLYKNMHHYAVHTVRMLICFYAYASTAPVSLPHPIPTTQHNNGSMYSTRQNMTNTSICGAVAWIVRYLLESNTILWYSSLSHLQQSTCHLITWHTSLILNTLHTALLQVSRW